MTRPSHGRKGRGTSADGAGGARARREHALAAAQGMVRAHLRCTRGFIIGMRTVRTLSYMPLYFLNVGTVSRMVGSWGITLHR